MEYIIPLCAIVLLTIAVWKSKLYAWRGRRQERMYDLTLVMRIGFLLMILMDISLKQMFHPLAIIIVGLVIGVGINESESWARKSSLKLKRSTAGNIRTTTH